MLYKLTQTKLLFLTGTARVKVNWSVTHIEQEKEKQQGELLYTALTPPNFIPLGRI